MRTIYEIARIIYARPPCTWFTKKLSSLFFSSHEGMSTGPGDGGGGGVGGVQSGGGGGGGGRSTPPHGSPTPMDKATLKVHLPNGKSSRFETKRSESGRLRIKGARYATKRLITARTHFFSLLRNVFFLRVRNLADIQMRVLFRALCALEERTAS